VVRSPKGISHFSKSTLEFVDGMSLPADVVVLATGYDNMRTSVKKVLGDKVASKCKDVWGLDQEGEVNAVSPGPWPYNYNSCADFLDLERQWAPWLLVYGWKPCTLQNLLQISRIEDQSSGGRFGGW
jgi:hypothetical protein